jgi:hypothetical protein
VALLLKLLDEALFMVLADWLVLPLKTPLLLLLLMLVLLLLLLLLMLLAELEVFSTTLVPIWLERISSSAYGREGGGERGRRS